MSSIHVPRTTAHEQLSTSGRWQIVAAVAALLLVCLGDARAARPGTSDSDLLNSQLATGEFGPALSTVRQLRDTGARDQKLDQIATAQARAGAPLAAVSTAAEIENDVTRSQALGEVTNARKSPLAGAAGGGVSFQPLMTLIKSTIAPDSWDDNGGTGSMQPYFNGVYVDATGVLRRTRVTDASDWLARVHRNAKLTHQASEVRQRSKLRMISLPRLERLVEMRLAAGLPLDDEMNVLAGLERIEYVLVYPGSHDLVIAGPAGDWNFDEEGRPRSTATGRPVVRLEDLVTLWRHMADRGGEFGCTIVPTEKGLAEAQAYLNATNSKPLKAGGGKAWLEQVRKRVGLQRIEVVGIDPRTTTARTLVAADHHMKLIGLGLEPAVLGMTSYLDSIDVPKGQSPPPVDVLRWWFTMNYEAIHASPKRDAFALVGQAVELKSENQLLAEQGRRVSTNQSEPLNREFAAAFTKHFGELAEKYPIYAELQNLFDLTLVGALIESEHLANQSGWHRTCFGSQGTYDVPLGAPPKMVDTVVNHRMVNGRQILAGVSGGVHADPRAFVKAAAIAIDADGKLERQRTEEQPASSLPRDSWWWD